MAVTALCLAATAWAGKDWTKVPNPDELMYEESFQLSDGARLHVDVSDVHIDLMHSDGNEATVKVYASGRNKERTQEFFEDLHFKAFEEENTLKVRTSRSMFRVSGPWNWSSRVRVHAIITVPRGTDMRVKTDDGDINAPRLLGPLDVRTSDGDIVIDEIEGPSLRARTSDGDIRVEKIKCDQVEVTSSDGDVHATEVAAAEISFSTSDGNVLIGTARVEESYLSSSDGDVTVDKLDGKKMRGRTSDGDIDVTLVGPTELDLRTSDGDIRIATPRGLGADINLKGERVRLSGNIDIQGDLSRERARGKIGGGGVEIVARTSDGTISLEQGR
jgi:DUF4097 and DUF4098 domain-containing protein YvlB